MGQQVTYVTWSQSNYVRLEIIQVDNTASHINVSCNLQIHSSFNGVGGLSGTSSSWDSMPYNGDLNYGGGSQIAFSGTNGTYSGSGWHGVANKWIGTIPRSGSFSIDWSTYWQSTDKAWNPVTISSGSIACFPYTPPNGKDSLSNYSAATIGTAVTFTVTNSTNYAHTDTLAYQIGSASGNISANFSVSANSTKTVTWTPAASLGAQIPNDWTGTVTLTLTTSGQGSNSYTCQLTVPTYTYTMNNMSVAKYGNYTAIGGSNYVAGKHTARWTMPTFPTAQYGATMTGAFYAISGGNVLYTKSVSSGGTADYTYSAAGTVTGSLRVEDSRGVMVQTTTGTTWVANPAVTVTFTAQRSGSTTTVNLVASGTYSTTVSGLAATLEISASGTPIQSSPGAGGSASITTTDTLALANSQEYLATMTDTLGNVATRRVMVPVAFFYLQVGGGDNGHGISIGRAASTSGTDTLEIGLPTTIDDETRVKMFREYMTVDVDNVTHFSARLFWLPRVTRTNLGLLDNSLNNCLQAYLKWIVKNFPYDMSRFLGILQCGGIYSVDVTQYSTAKDGNGMPEYTMGIAYSYGTSATYRFGTNNYTFSIVTFDQTNA